MSGPSDTARFKIDAYPSSMFPFGLYVRVRGFWSSSWERIECYESREKALQSYERLKDLPEYLP